MEQGYKKGRSYIRCTIVSILLALIFVHVGNAQVSSLSFSQSSGTYSEISGGTLLGTTSSDDQYFVDPAATTGGTTKTGVGLPIGFNFTLNGNTFDRFAVNNNGWISLGKSALTPSVNMATTSAYLPLASSETITPTELRTRISVLGRDLAAQTGASLRYEVLGTSPNQVLVIQWKNYKKYNATGDSYNAQIRLYETSNKVELIYGTMTNNATSTTLHVGLGGSSSTDFNNRSTLTNWNTTSGGASNTASCTISNSIFPASGLTFSWQLVSQSFTSSTTEQGSTNPILSGSTNQEIVRLKVVTTGSTNPISVNSVTFNTSGTTAVADITSAVCYYTTIASFSTGESFGDPVISPNGNISFTGTKALAAGDNYFWLAYNISGSATPGNVVDATCTQFQTSESELVRYPTVTDPAGSRTIIAPLSGTVTVGTGGTYPSLTGAGGLFATINTAGLNGNLTANIISDLTEDGSNALNEWAETPASSNFTLLIQSSAATERLIAGTVGDAMIRMNGADRVTVDGRVGGSGKYLRFRNSNTANYVLSFLNGAASNTFRNCFFEGANTSTGVVLFSTGNNRANTILDSEIKNISPSERPAYGVYFGATSDSSNTIMNCKIYDFTSYGIYLSAATGTIIDSCEIYMNTASTSSTVYGIYYTNTSATIPTYLVKNRIYGLGGSPTGAVKGIYTNGISNVSTNVRIENNTIKLEPVTTGTVDGIDYYGYAANSMYIYYNTIHIGGATTGGDSYGIRKRDDATNFTVINNSIQNSRTNTSGTASHYAIYISDIDFSALALDNNCYYTDGVGGKLGYWSTTVCTTLAAWQTASAKDPNSLNANPLMSVSTNLQPFTGSPLLTKGLPIVNITTDILNAVRSVTTPTIGAYENAVVPPGVDWCNLQDPGTYTKLEGVLGPVVYAQVYESGVTDPAGQGAGIQCWIGYSTDNNNPNTWTNWIAATFHGQSGNNDEYKATLPATLPAGTYYYASRFLLTGGAYQYGGFSGGFWDGTANVSGVLTVNDNSIWWANLQFPATSSITEGGSATIYGRAYVIDVTVSSDTSAAITAWIGVNSANTDPSTWTNDKWTRAFFNAHAGNNDEYIASIGNNLAPGTYYYATRYQFLTDPYVYGGYSAGGGNFWDGSTNVNGTLTVGELVADVPYYQNFDQKTAPAIPAGWLVENTNNDLIFFKTTSSNYRSSPNSMFIDYNASATMNDWAFTPSINLVGGTQYELVFYYKAESASYPEKLEVKFGQSKTSIGMTSEAVFSNTNITNTTWQKGTGTFTPATSGVYFIGFHGFSVQNMYNLYFDDVDIRVVPSATNSSTIAGGSTGSTTFGTTGTTIQFTVANGGDLNLTVDKIGSNPGGTPPGSLQNIAPQYWSITVTSGTVNGTYSITLDITGVPGVNNPAILHLLKRDNASGAWTDLGVANSISGNLLTWTGLTSFSEFGIGSDNDNPLPVQLSAFNVTTEARNALLSWETATEENAFKFVVEKKNIDAATWSVAGEVRASGNSNSHKKYNYTDQKLNSGKYSYRLKMIDNDGTFTYSDVVEVDISVPKDYAVSQNYPNPFNPTTKIDYQLPFDSRVQIELYNITGERVATLMNMDQKAGYYTFDFTNTSHLSSGVYIYRIIATGAAQDKPFTAVKKMVMMK